MTNIKLQVQKLIGIVNELEADFPGRHFTLDGYLVGSIGEVMAAYYYGVELYTASAVAHDGEVDGKKVQIKISQQDNIVINHEPDYLIVLYLNKNGNIYEVYNGPGKEPWGNASKRDSHNNRHMMVNKLMELDKAVCDDRRIPAIHTIFNFELALKKKVIRIVDTADGEKSRLSYCIEVKIYLKNGQFSDYVETVESDKIKNFSWLYRATNSLAKLPEDKDEKIELIRIIQACIESQNVPTEIIYPNSGWRIIKDIGWRYVYGSGAIGIPGNLIHTRRCDEEFMFPPASLTQFEIFNEALSMINICKSKCASTILLLFTHAATLSTFFEEMGFSINFILGIVGVTNSRKTSLALELARIFNTDKKRADAEFTATAAGIEKTLSKFKDAPILIDDFRPGETRTEQLELNKRLEALVRFYGNRIPKKRMDDYAGKGGKVLPNTGSLRYYDGACYRDPIIS